AVLPFEREARDDRGAGRLYPADGRGQIPDPGGTPDVSRIHPPPVGAGHARAEDRQIAEPLPDRRRLARKGVAPDLDHAPVVALGMLHRPVLADDEYAPVGSAPVDREETPLHGRPLTIR